MRRYVAIGALAVLAGCGSDGGGGGGNGNPPPPPPGEWSILGDLAGFIYAYRSTTDDRAATVGYEPLSDNVVGLAGREIGDELATTAFGGQRNGDRRFLVGFAAVDTDRDGDYGDEIELDALGTGTFENDGQRLVLNYTVLIPGEDSIAIDFVGDLVDINASDARIGGVADAARRRAGVAP